MANGSTHAQVEMDNTVVVPFWGHSVILGLDWRTRHTTTDCAAEDNGLSHSDQSDVFKAVSNNRYFVVSCVVSLFQVSCDYS